jgi:hypothetical protein
MSNAVLPELPLSPLCREAMLTMVARLPRRPLDDHDVTQTRFRLAKDGRTEVFWFPSDATNPRAQVMFVGVTPGLKQTKIAYEAVRDRLAENPQLSYVAACRAAKRHAAFAGMRQTMCGWLDELAVHKYLGLPTSNRLFDDCRSLLHTTSAVRYMVLVDGVNYTGSNGGKMLETPILLPFIELLLARELRKVPDALVVPLGDQVSAVLLYLAVIGAVDEKRLLIGFPHPSGANGHKAWKWPAARSNLRRKVGRWFEER